MPTFAAKAFLAWGLLLAGTADAQTQSTAPIIGDIRVESVNVFDPRVPGENFWLFRAANKIHVVTKEPVIRRELLIAPGQPWNPLKILESERNLRLEGRFRKVEISSAPSSDGKLDLTVRSQDSWTTNIQFSLGTEGGDHFLIYGAEENNLLGRNKSLGFLHSQVGPIIRNRARYNDPRLLGSRYQFSTFYGTNPGGESRGVRVKRPFFALDTPWAMDASWSRLLTNSFIFQNGIRSSEFNSDVLSAQAAAGKRLRENPMFVQRAQAGWYAERDRFARTTGTTQPLPADRELSGPTLGYSWVQARYVKENYVNLMERIEDFNLGNELRLLGGYMPAAFSSDRDRAIFNASDQQGLSLGDGRFLLAQAGIAGRMAGGKMENSIWFANANLFWKTRTALAQTWVGHAEINLGRRLDGENQILLGGNNGLRGYKNYSFAGTRSILFNIEDRVFFPGEYFHFMRWGAAVFLDVGAVAPEGQRLSSRYFHSDLGAGLRFSSTRSTGGHVLRVDLAHALDPGPGPSRWVLTIRGGQAFALFNSSSRLVKQSPGSTLEISPPNDPLSPR